MRQSHKLSLLILVCNFIGHSAQACTTFGVIDPKSKSVIVAKNRDNRPDRQVIVVVASPAKFKYLALSRSDVPNFVSAGINEHNLAVFNEVTIEHERAATGGIDDDFSRDILQNYSSVKSVIPDLPRLVARYPDPVFYQVADRHYILNIEVAPKQQFRYQLLKAGAFAHTNNYLESSLITNYPYTPTERLRRQDSTARAKRALTLVEQLATPNLAAMQTIAFDHSAGPNSSILRSGDNRNPTSVKSLAFFGVQISQNSQESSMVLANLYNVNERYSLQLDNQFWSKYTEGYTVLKPNN